MELLPVDLIELIGVIMGTAIVLIPVIGLTARFALKPIVTVLGRYLRGKDTEESVQIVERRLALLEQQLDDVQGSLRRLLEVSEFDAQLRAGGAGALPGVEDAEPDSEESGGP